MVAIATVHLFPLDSPESYPCRCAPHFGSLANTFSLVYAVAGNPAITVPTQLATGLTLIGPYLSDGKLVGYAYAFEQATGARTEPPLGR